MSIVVSALLRLALAELSVARAGEGLSAEDQDDALALFNEYLDALNAENRGLYNTTIPTVFTLTPNHQPHTIGITANAPDLTVSVARPIEITRANIVLADDVRVPLHVTMDPAEWMAIRNRAVTSSVPSDLYYDPAWPNGNVYLWPIPTDNDLELACETLLAQVTADTVLDLPPGYQQMLRLTLAEICAPAWGQTISDDTRRQAALARQRVFGRNTTIPSLVTRDAGMPGGRGGSYDYRTGFVGGR